MPSRIYVNGNEETTMDVAIIETSGLGDRSYLVSDRGVGVVIDPNATSTAC